MLRRSAPASAASGCSQQQQRLLEPARLVRSSGGSSGSRPRRAITTVAAASTSSSSRCVPRPGCEVLDLMLCTPAQPQHAHYRTRSPEFLPLGDGDAIVLPRARPDIGPAYMLSKEEAVEVQMQVSARAHRM